MPVRPWDPGADFTGLCENVEYVVTPAVIVTFITAYVNGIFGFDAAYSPIIWIVTYLIFLYLNIYGVALSFKVTLVITLLSLAVLIVFWISAIPNMDFNRWALNIGPDGAELPKATAPTSRLASPVYWRPFLSRYGSSSLSSSCLWPPRNWWIPSATCPRASFSAC